MRGMAVGKRVLGKGTLRVAGRQTAGTEHTPYPWTGRGRWRLGDARLAQAHSFSFEPGPGGQHLSAARSPTTCMLPAHPTRPTCDALCRRQQRRRRPLPLPSSINCHACDVSKSCSSRRQRLQHLLLIQVAHLHHACRLGAVAMQVWPKARQQGGAGAASNHS